MGGRRHASRAIVLSGGGALGAYEAGVVAGIVEVLGVGPADPPPFRVFAGTSVGAVNATFLAAHADRGDMHVQALLERWRALRVMSHLRVGPGQLAALSRWVRMRLRRPPREDDPVARSRGRSALELGPIERFTVESIPWDRLHRNVDDGRVHAVIATAQHVRSGRTHVFVEQGPGARYVPSRDRRRVSRLVRVGPDHVLAASAVPFVFPIRRVDGAWFCDSAFTYNTPIAPAIRAGADALTVISLALLGLEAPPRADEGAPDTVQLLARLLASVIVDRVDSDLLVLDRVNGMVELLERGLEPDDLDRFSEVVRETRGVPYRHVDTLVFRASRELSALGAAHLREMTHGGTYGRLVEWFFGGAGNTAAATLLSFLLFDGDFAARLIELGLETARSRAPEIRAFFGVG